MQTGLCDTSVVTNSYRDHHAIAHTQSVLLPHCVYLNYPLTLALRVYKRGRHSGSVVKQRKARKIERSYL